MSMNVLRTVRGPKRNLSTLFSDNVIFLFFDKMGNTTLCKLYLADYYFLRISIIVTQLIVSMTFSFIPGQFEFQKNSSVASTA